MHPRTWPRWFPGWGRWVPERYIILSKHISVDSLLPWAFMLPCPQDSQYPSPGLSDGRTLQEFYQEISQKTWSWKLFRSYSSNESGKRVSSNHFKYWIQTAKKHSKKQFVFHHSPLPLISKRDCIFLWHFLPEARFWFPHNTLFLCFLVLALSRPALWHCFPIYVFLSHFPLLSTDMSHKPITRMSDSLGVSPANGHHVGQEAGKRRFTGNQTIMLALWCPLKQEFNYPN